MNSVMLENGEFVLVSRDDFDIVKDVLFSSCEKFLDSDNSEFLNRANFAIGKYYSLDARLMLLSNLELLSQEEYKILSARLYEKLESILLVCN